jgi:hypothetical protein
MEPGEFDKAERTGQRVDINPGHLYGNERSIDGRLTSRVKPLVAFVRYQVGAYQQLTLVLI